MKQGHRDIGLANVGQFISEGRWMAWLLRGMIAATLLGAFLDISGQFNRVTGSPNPIRKPQTLKIKEMVPPTDESIVTPYTPGELPVVGPSETRTPPRLPTGEVAPDPILSFMQFQFRRTSAGVPYIIGNGNFDVGVFEAFKRIDHQHNQEARYFIINSTGGVVTEALQMAFYIRERGIKIIVPEKSYCMSACTIAIAGGVERVIYPNAWVGVHRMYISGQSMGSMKQGFEDGQAATAFMMKFYEEMGISAQVWRWAIETDSSKMRFLSNGDLEETKLASIVSQNILMR